MSAAWIGLKKDNETNEYYWFEHGKYAGYLHYMSTNLYTVLDNMTYVVARPSETRPSWAQVGANHTEPWAVCMDHSPVLWYLEEYFLSNLKMMYSVGLSLQLDNLIVLKTDYPMQSTDATMMCSEFGHLPGTIISQRANSAVKQTSAESKM